jgi:putative addiction module killer protein
LGDEGDGVPFKVGRILFSSMSSHDTPPLAIIALFEVSISTRPLHLWLDGLSDIRARARIQVRVERLAAGNTGDVKPVGEGVSELRINYGPGYRVYFTKRGRKLIVLLAGGDKSTQATDIKIALRLARNL